MMGGIDERDGGADRPSGPDAGSAAGDGNVRCFPGVGPIDELVPMGPAARAPADEVGADAGNVRFFPGVGPIDELIPMGSSASTTVAAPDDVGTENGNIRMFPGVGPIDELIPMGPAKKAPVVATMNADAFWGEDSQFLHQAIAAPPGATLQSQAIVGPEPRPGSSGHAGPFFGRLLIRVAMMFLSLAGLAFASNVAGLWGTSPTTTPRSGARHRAQPGTHSRHGQRPKSRADSCGHGGALAQPGFSRDGELEDSDDT